MDEAESGTTASRDALSAEAARQWAEQQRAQARAQFATPSWIGPGRGATIPSQVPAQAEPEHDQLEVVAPVVRGAPIPDTAHWTDRASPRIFAGLLLVLAVLGVLTSLAFTVATQSPVAIAGLAACAIVAVIFRGALIGAGVTTVDLKGSVLRVRRGGVEHVANLADPVHIVELIGNPDQPTWRLRLEAVDGHTIEIGRKMVDAPELHRIVAHYRALADRARREREERFRR